MDITGIGTALDFAGNIIDRLWPKKATLEERTKAVAAIAPLIKERDDGLVQSKERIMVAEMSQGDTYTKRARPTVVYAGLLFIFLVNVMVPAIIKIILILGIVTKEPGQLATMKAVAAELTGLTGISLPTEFWLAWGGVVSVWSIGRSAERRGAANKLIEMVTGIKK